MQLDKFLKLKEANIAVDSKYGNSFCLASCPEYIEFDNNLLRLFNESNITVNIRAKDFLLQQGTGLFSVKYVSLNDGYGLDFRTLKSNR